MPMRKFGYREIKDFVLSNQAILNRLTFLLTGFAAMALSSVIYNKLYGIQASVDLLVSGADSSVTLHNIHSAITESITALIVIVILGMIFSGLLVWKLGQHVRLSQLLVSRDKDGICITDKNLKIQSVNQEFCRLTGLSESDLYGTTLYHHFPSLFPSNGTSTVEAFSREVVEQGGNGTPSDTEVTLTFTPQTKHSTKFGVLTIRDITKLKQSELNFRHLAYTDDLTHLPNRAHLMDYMETLINDSASFEKRFALFFLDLDGFKDINDSLGHQAGDDFLKLMAQRLSNNRRENDFVARLGGDEFCIVIEDFSDLTVLYEFSERLLERVAEPIMLADRSITPQTSIGYALYPEHGDNKEALLQAADMAMYKAKNAGKHRAVLFDPNITSSVRDRLDLEHDLRIALQEQQFVLFYQPQVSLQTGQMTGVEALIRWQHPERGMIQPDQFIDTIERLGLMETLGDWVILDACKQQRHWQDRGVDIDVAVNISGSHFQSEKLVNSTMNALLTAGVAPERLELEITEDVMQVADTTIDNFVALRNLGVKIAIDDFGTGYSSLGSLRTLPVDHLKVDRMFLHDVLVDKKQAVIISTIIGMAQALSLKVIVEGVETMDHILLLQSLGCNIVQGYYFSKAVPSTEIPNLYHRGFYPEKPSLLNNKTGPS